MAYSLEWELERIMEQMRPKQFSPLSLLDGSLQVEAYPQPLQGLSRAHDGRDVSSSSSFVYSLPPVPSPASQLGMRQDGLFLLQEAAPPLTGGPPPYTVIAQGPDPMYSWVPAQNPLQGRDQYLPYQRPVGAVSYPADPPPPYYDPTLMMYPGVDGEGLPCAQGLMLDDDRPYVKKPPNAFMLFIREQRDNVDPELKKQGSAAVNVFLGQVWSSLNREHKAKYLEQAEGLRVLHKQQYPGWSDGNNYGRKRKKGSPMSLGNVEGASAIWEEDLQAKRWCGLQLPADMDEEDPPSMVASFPLRVNLP